MEWVVKRRKIGKGRRREREVDREREEMVEYCYLSLGRWVISIEAGSRKVPQIRKRCIRRPLGKKAQESNPRRLRARG